MPDVLNFQVILDTIRKNDKYSSELIDIAPDIKADIVSFQGNPNCGCRRKIVEYVEKNKETEPIKSFFTKWSQELPNQYTTVKPGEQATPGANGVTSVHAVNQPPVPGMKPMMGHVVEIPASPDEYKKLIEHARNDRWMYRGVSVMPKDDKWLLFFY